jgi:hypothetical protein
MPTKCTLEGANVAVVAGASPENIEPATEGDAPDDASIFVA